MLAVNVPVVSYTRKPEEITAFYKEAIRRISELPGVERVALGTVVPWRDPGFFAAQFTAEGYAKANGEEDPRAQFRTVSPGFFSALGVRIIAGRDFNEDDRRDGEKVVIVSQSLAQRMFPNMDAVNRRLMWTDPVTKFIGVSTEPRRIVGVVPDVDDENVVPKPTMTVYHPMEQEMSGGRLFVHAKVDPYALVPTITKVIRDLAADQPVERAGDAGRRARGGAGAQSHQRARVQRVRRRRAGDRRRRRRRRAGVLGERAHARVRRAPGDRVDAVGAAGARPARRRGDWRQRHRRGRDRRPRARARRQQLHHRDPDSGAVPIVGAAAVLVAAAILASLMPAARASRVDVISALEGRVGRRTLRECGRWFGKHIVRRENRPNNHRGEVRCRADHAAADDPNLHAGPRP